MQYFLGWIFFESYLSSLTTDHAGAAGGTVSQDKADRRGHSYSVPGSQGSWRMVKLNLYSPQIHGKNMKKWCHYDLFMNHLYHIFVWFCMCNKVIFSECQIVRVISVVIFWQDATVSGTGLHAEGSVLFASNREMVAIACQRLKSPVTERVRSDAYQCLSTWKMGLPGLVGINLSLGSLFILARHVCPFEAGADLWNLIEHLCILLRLAGCFFSKTERAGLPFDQHSLDIIGQQVL